MLGIDCIEDGSVEKGLGRRRSQPWEQVAMPRVTKGGRAQVEWRRHSLGTAQEDRAGEEEKVKTQLSAKHTVGKSSQELSETPVKVRSQGYGRT